MFDVFLAHNSKDKSLVREIYQKLKERGLNPWLDEEHIPPGTAFQDEIQQAIAQVKTAAILLGETGLGRWQAVELRSFITQCVERSIPVIPVLLPGVSSIPDNLLFLKEFHAVSFDNDIEDEKAFDRLCCGITGKKANGQIHDHLSSDTQRERDTAASILQGKIATKDFDVFLCHNSEDKQAVKQIGTQLKELGILPWLDEWELRPGLPWQKTLEEQIKQIKSAAVFVGKNGIGPWQNAELAAFLRQFVKRECPVIPVILQDCDRALELPVFLEGMMWVNFRQQEPDPIEQLLWGITGEKANGQTHDHLSSSHIKNEPSSESGSSASSQLNILHLSDLHFGTLANARDWYKRLRDDLKNKLNCSKLDVLIISGDIANESTVKEYKAARQFLESICQEFQLDSKQIVIVPGEHDVNRILSKQAYRIKRFEEYRGPVDSEGRPDSRYAIYKEGQDHIEVLSQEKYKQRFKNFSTFYKAVKGEPYPSDYAQQATFHHFPEHNLLILGLNSAWEVDHYYDSRISLFSDALSNAIDHIHQNREIYEGCLKFAVWHHPLSSSGKDKLETIVAMQRLAQAGFCTIFCGHLSKAEVDEYHSEPISVGETKVHLICAGTFGTPTKTWKSDYPLQYNFLNLVENRLIVETRCRRTIDGEWESDAIWKSPLGEDCLPYYEIALPQIANTRAIPDQVQSNSSTSEYEDIFDQALVVPQVEDNEPKSEPDLNPQSRESDNFAEYRQQLEELLEKEAKTSKQKSTATNPPLKRVLIIAICPKDTSSLNLAEEVREICDALQRSSNFTFIVEVRWAARFEDLREAMLEFEPHIVHFSGHGVGADGLAFEDKKGQVVLIPLKPIVDLFKLFSEQVKHLIECVVLNACYSEVQAEAMMSYVGCVIGMQQAIGDIAAIEFSKGFYVALADGKTLDFAFKWGCNGIQAKGLPEDLVPTLKKSTLFSNTLRTENVTDSRHLHDPTNAHERLLILAANPKNTDRLRLDEEVREIYAELKRARQQGQIVLEQRWAARFRDLQEGLFEFRPTIVHFCGHGAGDQGVVFESEDGDIHFVRNQPLSSLFSISPKQVKCVLINTDYSQIQAQEIVNHIDYTIGFSNAVGDKTHITYSRGFYRGFKRGLSIERAHKWGIIELQSQDIPEDQWPILNKKTKGSAS